MKRTTFRPCQDNLAVDVGQVVSLVSVHGSDSLVDVNSILHSPLESV